MKQLFIVSDVTLEDVEDAEPNINPLWAYKGEATIVGVFFYFPYLSSELNRNFVGRDYDIPIMIRVRNSTLEKCPRCWTFTRHEEQTLCKRCSKVTRPLEIL